MDRRPQTAVELSFFPVCVFMECMTVFYSPWWDSVYACVCACVNCLVSESGVEGVTSGLFLSGFPLEFSSNNNKYHYVILIYQWIGPDFNFQNFPVCVLCLCSLFLSLVFSCHECHDP